MAVVCTADPHFRAEHLQQLVGLPNLALHQVEGAGHSLEVDDYQTSLDILRNVAGHCAALIG